MNEFSKKIKETQKDKDGKIIYLYASDKVLSTVILLKLKIKDMRFCY